MIKYSPDPFGCLGWVLGVALLAISVYMNTFTQEQAVIIIGFACLTAVRGRFND